MCVCVFGGGSSLFRTLVQKAMLLNARIGCINFVYSLSNLGSPKGIGSPLDPPESIESKKKTYIFQVIPRKMKRV